MKKLIKKIKDTLSILHSSKGFTLLELLVVVLIIGILAGIALPQYRKAVGKAELTQIISATKAVQNAQERYYLINNTYATSFSMLDINLPSNNISCRINTGLYSACYNKNYVIAHYYSQNDDDDNNKIECYARNKKLITACESFLNKSAYLRDNYICNLMQGVEKPCLGVAGKIRLPM